MRCFIKIKCSSVLLLNNGHFYVFTLRRLHFLGFTNYIIIITGFTNYVYLKIVENFNLFNQAFIVYVLTINYE